MHLIVSRRAYAFVRAPWHPSLHLLLLSLDAALFFCYNKYKQGRKDRREGVVFGDHQYGSEVKLPPWFDSYYDSPSQFPPKLQPAAAGLLSTVFPHKLRHQSHLPPPIVLYFSQQADLHTRAHTHTHKLNSILAAIY
jgi:hypothetical protein